MKPKRSWVMWVVTYQRITGETKLCYNLHPTREDAVYWIGKGTGYKIRKVRVTEIKRRGK